MDSASTVAVVVPSPAISEVFDATSRTSCAPIFSYGSSSSISFATVTPSFVIVGLPNFLSRITLRPLGPSVALTARDSFSMPRSNACRAFSSNCNCLAAISYFLLRLTDDAEDVVLAHDQVRLIVDLDFSAAVFRDQHLVAFFHGEIDLLAFFVHLARAESDDFALLRFFLSGIGNNDAALFCFLLFNRLHQHPVSKRFYINCCHKFIYSFCFFGLSRRLSILQQSPANCFLLLLLVFVHDFEFCIDNVAVTAAALPCAFFGARTRTSFRSGLRTRLRSSLC